MEIVAKAIVSQLHRSNVLIAPHRAAPDAVAQTRDVEPRGGVALAATTSPALATWLVESINRLLDGAAWDQPRPPGDILKHGEFLQSNGDTNVCVESVAAGTLAHGNRVDLARCPDAARATELITRLNSFLSD
jgi:hypothetical protein